MCGIFGYFDKNKNTLHDNQLLAMGESIRYRGPDGYGCHHDEESAVALGNQRLAILDVEHGQQPFISDDGKIVVVQNGEIFNHVELAQELAHDGYICRTKCDTEVILRIYERDGIEGIARLNGMFAIAILDKRNKELYLVRDRAGEKPLYYLNDNGRILFASEIKAILEVSGHRNLNPDALNQFFTFNYVPPPLTMFEGIEHVMPGHWLRISRSGIEDKCWWDISEFHVVNHSEGEWMEQFNHLLDDAVRIRLRSDVPFGAFLSGGVDSSSVVGLMSNHLSEPVNTFTIGFDDPKYDESPFAQEAADRFSTNHKSEIVNSNLLDLWPMSIYHCDQPHGDVSFLPMYKVASLAAQNVKMVLTGDGADELFAGYDKHGLFFNSEITQLSEGVFQHRYFENISLFEESERNRLFTKKFKSKVNSLDTFEVLQPLYAKSEHMDRINKALYIDMKLLLPGNNLVKTDRMSMAVSLENRTPFLDYRIMELAFSMPGDLKLRNGTSKYIYKKAVAPLTGENLAYRRKQMFTVPVGDWFKTDLYKLCDDLLLSSQTRERGIFNHNYVRFLFKNHCEGVENNTSEIRALMAVETWFREFNM